MSPHWKINFLGINDDVACRHCPWILGTSCGRYLCSGWTPGNKFSSAAAAKYWISSYQGPSTNLNRRPSARLRMPILNRWRCNYTITTRDTVSPVASCWVVVDWFTYWRYLSYLVPTLFWLFLAMYLLVKLTHFCGQGATLWSAHTTLSPQNLT